MIKKIEVKKLFGAFHHIIELKDDNVTLMLGENGLGKTIILQMIKAFFQKDFFDLQSNLFSEFILVFTNEDKILIKKIENKDKDGYSLNFKFTGKGKKKAETYRMRFSSDESLKMRRRMTHYADDYIFRDVNYQIHKYVPFPIERIGGDQWMDRNKGIVYSTESLLERYANYFPSHLKRPLNEELPAWLVKKTELIKTKLIETQRLLTKIKAEAGEYSSTVVKYSKELIEKIKNKTVEATNLASKLDRSYPNRVIKKITQTSKITDTELGEGLTKLNKRRELLNKVGLIDSEEENLQQVTNAIKQAGRNKDLLKDVLQIYLEDSNEKLTIYDELAKRIDLLITIINKRFLYKKITIDKSKGFVFTSLITGKDIPLSGLSSGEQHELVLFFELLFNTEPNSLLLIDEPEISLHVSWQNHFINDLKDVFQLNDLSAIIATHSPDIINNNWTRTVQLKGE
jgi:predicted ATP-binding protein involved in virulence